MGKYTLKQISKYLTQIAALTIMMVVVWMTINYYSEEVRLSILSELNSKIQQIKDILSQVQQKGLGATEWGMR